MSRELNMERILKWLSASRFLGTNWSCKGETKGGYTQLVHKKIIVTSNYMINELFKDSGDDMVASTKWHFKCTVFSDHLFNGNPIRPLDPVARGLWNQCGILQDNDTLGT